VPLANAHALLDGDVDTWQHLEQSGGDLTVVAGPGVIAAGAIVAESHEAALNEVRSDPDTLALVPAIEVDPTVRVVPVAGVHPLRERDDYPLRTQVADTALPGPPVTVTVVGDIMLGRRVGDLMAAQDDFAAPLRPMAERLSDADVTIGNLENTLSRDGSPTQGGDSFAADPAVEEGLRLAGFDVLSLANNHVGDWGERALVQTVERVQAMNIETIGAGANLDQAREPVIVEHDGVRLGIIAFDSIGESPAAGADRPGTNRLNMPPRTGPLDSEQLERLTGDVRALSEQSDVVLVLPHWGTQYTYRPEDSQHAVAEALADAGADLVIGGHPHWVQGWEMMSDTLIIHSLGNFVFDMDFSREVQEGVFVEVVMWGDDVLAAEPVPYVIDDYTPSPADDDRAQQILDLMWEASRPPFGPAD
jgi:poly-gamma-glutamate synthesis protein (capsule biosynthesis protein)